MTNVTISFTPDEIAALSIALRSKLIDARGLRAIGMCNADTVQVYEDLSLKVKNGIVERRK